MPNSKPAPEPTTEKVDVKCCPFCTGTNLYGSPEWFAHSLDPSDIMNVGVLEEIQCADCARSFWV